MSASQPAVAEITALREPASRHPRTFAPATLILVLALSAVGAIIGLQLLVTLGVTPNTSLVGALVAIVLARVPLAAFRRYRSIHVQNLAQSAISAATFGAANSLLLPLMVPPLVSGLLPNEQEQPSHGGGFRDRLHNLTITVGFRTYNSYKHYIGTDYQARRAALIQELQGAAVPA